jgi:hypothetical protein
MSCSTGSIAAALQVFQRSRELAHYVGQAGTIPACPFGSSAWRDSGPVVRGCVMTHAPAALEMLESMEET